MYKNCGVYFLFAFCHILYVFFGVIFRCEWDQNGRWDQRTLRLVTFFGPDNCSSSPTLRPLTFFPGFFSKFWSLVPQGATNTYIHTHTEPVESLAPLSQRSHRLSTRNYRLWLQARDYRLRQQARDYRLWL